MDRMWEAIQYIGSGFTLAAFVVAVIAWVVKSKSEERERLIGSATEKDRADLVRDALEFFRVDTTGLTKDQQYQLALEQIRSRAQRFKIVATVVCTIAVLGAGVATYAIVRSNPSATGDGTTSMAPARDDKKPLTLSGSIWRVELDSKGSLLAAKEFPAGSGQLSAASLKDFAQWVSNQLGVAAQGAATPKIYVKVQIPADLAHEKPIIERVPEGKMDLLLWDVRGNAKSRTPLTWEAVKEMRTPFQLEVRIPGAKPAVIETTPGTALTKEITIEEQPVRIGVEKFAGPDEGITARVCTELSANPLIQVVNPEMLEVVRKELEANKEYVRNNPMMQMSVRSLAIDYILSGSVEVKTP